MRRKSAERVVIFAVAGLLVASAIWFGAADDQRHSELELVIQEARGKDLDSPEFKALLSKLPKIERSNKVPLYVLEGDLGVNEDQVWTTINAGNSTDGGTTQVSPNSELNVMFRDGVADRWDWGDRNLTFAIDKNSFEYNDQYEFIRNNVSEASSPWTAGCSCDLYFTHLERYDLKPSLDSVKFIVKFDPTAFGYYAAAFFPKDPADTRYLIIGPLYFEQREYDKVGILTHEFGHILGYRHGHIGDVKGCAFFAEKDGLWKPLGPYDRKSVMHYLCGKGGTASFKLSQQDREDHFEFYRQRG